MEFAKKFNVVPAKMIRDLKYFSKHHYLILIVSVFLFVTCKQSDQNNLAIKDSENTQEISFDDEKWKTKESLDYPFRDEMLNDLMTDPHFRKHDKDELMKLLGDADRIDGNYLFYTIDQKRIGLWPLHTKTLVIKFNENDSVQWMKIHE